MLVRTTSGSPGQPTRHRITNATEIKKQPYGVNTCLETTSTDQFDPWQVVPRQAFTPYSRLLISAEFVVVSRVSCLGVTGVRALECVSRLINCAHS